MLVDHFKTIVTGKFPQQWLATLLLKGPAAFSQTKFQIFNLLQILVF